MDVNVEAVFQSEDRLDEVCNQVITNGTRNVTYIEHGLMVGNGSNESAFVSLYQTCEEYECDCSSGVILPVWGGEERNYCYDIPGGEAAGRSILYLICLLYCFLGVSIIADRFMAAIEVITSQKRVVTTVVDGVEQKFKVLVWNETVANLTLMALGSSAPEILLSIIEIVGNNFQAGELGPSTIVGSAAFNMFVIFAICVTVIPSSETRTIRELPVFFLTAATSIFAYVWLFIIVRGTSKDEIEVWEAVVTFLFFPALIIVAFLTDRKFFISKWRKYRVNQRRVVVAESVKKGEGVHYSKGLEEGGDDDIAISDRNDDDRQAILRKRREDIDMASAVLKSKHDALKGADKETVRKFAAYEMLENTPKSRAFYRMNAIRNLTGSRGILPVKPKIADEKVRGASAEAEDEVPLSVGFVEPTVSVMENVGSVALKVRRDGTTQCKLEVHYYTEDKEAKAGEDYKPVKDGVLVFDVGETEKTISIEIVDDDIFEDTERFFVKLRNVVTLDGSTAKLRPGFTVCMVTILDDDHHGRFVFELDKYEVQETDGYCTVTVLREMGARGHVRIPIATKPGTAKGGGDDYEDIDEVLQFEDGESRKEVKIRIIDDEEYERDEEFYVLLGKPEEVDVTTGSADGPDPTAVLGDCCKTTVAIIEDHEFKNDVDAVIRMATLRLKVGSSSWADQFKDCFYVNGKPDWSEAESLDTRSDPTILDYVMHFATFPWKLLFALVPPTKILGGWATFVVAIVFIGILTAFIGDLANAFGCSAGLNADVTAITFVALGTSLPDAFASKTAAVQDKYADGSLGNVTGSNSVNVFLGLGLAWLIASIYHAANGDTFKVAGGESLGFSVVVFCVFAIICIIALMIRRFFPPIHGELGGPLIYKIPTAIFFVLLWILYIILSSLVSYGHIESF